MGHYARSSSRDILNVKTQFNMFLMYSEGTQEISCRRALKEIVGDKSNKIALQLQKSVITSSLNIARLFKLLK